jgi:hypothetical protein
MLLGVVVMARRRARYLAAYAVPQAPTESRSMVFISGFIASLVVSGVGFYAATYASVAALLVIVGFVVVEMLTVLPMYQNRAVYVAGAGLGLVGGFLTRDVIKLVFDGLAYAGVLIGRAVAFTTSPKPYDAAALMMFLVVTTQYALMMAVNTVLMALFISMLFSWWLYPDLVFTLSVFAMYPFYTMWLYMFTWGLLYLLLSGAVYMFWLSSFATAFLGAIGFIEFLLALAGIGFIGTRFVAEAFSSVVSTISGMFGVYAEAGELDRFSRSTMLYFILYSFGAGLSGVIAHGYPYYASMFMAAYTVFALGIWSTFGVMPIATQIVPTGKLAWLPISRAIRSGSLAITFVCVALIIGYGHGSASIVAAAVDFINFYGPSIREFIGDVVRWILAPI